MDIVHSGQAEATGSRLLLVGVDHRTASLDLREKVSFTSEESSNLLARLLAREDVEESYLLSTCNRTELYVQTPRATSALQAALDGLFRHRAPEILEQGRYYVRHDKEAGRHLLEVASGLQSMVVGEPEILGQVRRAAVRAASAGATGTLLRRLLHLAVQAGRRARKETRISAGGVSLGYAVVELARNIYEQVSDISVLVLGAGETATMVVRCLTEQGVGRLAMANRTRERAEEVQRRFPACRILSFEERLEGAREADLVVASTGATEPILTFDDVHQVMKNRRDRPLLAIDLGVPRNISDEARSVESFFLHDIDSLQSLIDRNLALRRTDIPRVHGIIEEELAHYESRVSETETEELVAQLQRWAESVRRQEVDTALRRLPDGWEEPLDRLTRSLVRKLLHHPSSRLRESSATDSLLEMDLVRELFQLERESMEKGKKKGKRIS